MEEKQKILFCGDVEGKFNSLFNRVESINKKSGPFDLLLCVGNFFGVNNKEFESYKLQIKKVAIPTYILGPNKEEHVHLYPEEGSELCPNVHYLGKRGLYTNSNSLKIAYISGIAKNNSTNDTYTYNIEDAVALRDVCRRGNSNFKGVDILITSQWPNDVMKFDTKYNLRTSVNMQTDVTAWLNIQLKPRYHISGLEGVFYECPPYRIPSISEHDSSVELATRFLGLARVGNPHKDKWLYALSLTPLDKMEIKELCQKTTDEINCPFNLIELENKLFSNKRKLSQPSQYFYDMKAYEDITNKEHKKGKRQKVEFDQNKCWFCLASSSVEKHLVVTVGNLVYLALAKGALVDEHFLICPVEHHQCVIGLSEAVLKELQEFKAALIKYYGANGKVPVFFERNYKTSHMQIQAIPIPKNAVKELKEIFMDEAEGHGFKLEELDSHNRLEQVIPTAAPYFCVELPSGETLYIKIQSKMDFPLNFGREVLASGPILNLSERIDWKDCILSKADEETLVKRIRSDFSPFDFT
ncbi:hypothetical protein ILUMI_06297 [Ignelater luminosus]|uniref:CWF19-like protein 1 n=1 Tax=Ignelater luminosus TaxID=2038154 RepID=A0A8K0DFV8_IGNLU|nr:hypothetical protein ILUMI_06297 [Ignelater luminosus]